MGVILPTLTDLPRSGEVAIRRIAAHGDSLEAAHRELAALVARQPAALTLADIRSALQSGGFAPLNITSLLGTGSGGIIKVGTHAQRVLLAASSQTNGTTFLETDRHAVYVVVNRAWALGVAIYFDLIANQPADLGLNDAGFVFVSTNKTKSGGLAYRWSGTAWLWYSGWWIDAIASRPAVNTTNAGAIFGAIDYQHITYRSAGVTDWVLLEGVGGPMRGTLLSADQRPGGLGLAETGFKFLATDAGNQLYRWDGTAWILIEGWGTPLLGTRISADQRPGGLGSGDAGFYFQATDAGNQLYRWSGSAWVIQVGYGVALKGTLSPDTRPATLGTSDANFRFFSTDYDRPYRWTGTVWVDDIQAPTRYLVAIFDATPDENGWFRCDGSTVLQSKADGTTANYVTNDMTTNKRFLRADTSVNQGSAGTTGTDYKFHAGIPYVRL